MISRSREKLETVKNRLHSEKHKNLVVYPCDVTDSDEMTRVLLDVHHTYGQIDVLIANAGISFRQQLLINSFEKAVRETFDVNINGVINTVLPLIEVKGVRQIAVVSSQAAYAPIVSPMYGATKQCVLLLSRDLRRLLAKDGIAVNTISPGPVVTPMIVGSPVESVAHGVSVETAAQIIFQGLRRNEEEIVFPAFTGIFQYAISLLPLFVAEPIVRRILPTRR